jgi:hypothetical protein
VGDCLKKAYVWVYRSAQEPDRTLKPMDTLNAEKVVSGFAVDITFFKACVSKKVISEKISASATESTIKRL